MTEMMTEFSFLDELIPLNVLYFHNSGGHTLFEGQIFAN